MGQTEKIVLEVPAGLASELMTANQDMLADLLRRGLRDLRIEQALERYKQGGISFAAAAELAGVTQPELARAAYVRGIEPSFDEEMVAEELTNGNSVDWSESDPDVDREMEAYIAMHPTLKQHYFGQYVAIYGGQLVDHDQDYTELFTRIDQAYPDEFVWMAKVEDEPLPTFYHRSPRLIRNG